MRYRQSPQIRRPITPDSRPRELLPAPSKVGKFDVKPYTQPSELDVPCLSSYLDAGHFATFDASGPNPREDEP